MSKPSPPDKPYNVYHSGTAPGAGPDRPARDAGAFPPAAGEQRGGRLKEALLSTGRRGGDRVRSDGSSARGGRGWGDRLVLALLAGAVALAVVAVAAFAGWGPFGDGEATAERAGPAAASAAASLAPSPSSASPEPSPSPTPTPGFSVTAGGDVIGGFGVSGLVDSMHSKLFEDIAPWFERSDFGFVNLESPLTTGGEAQGWKDVVIKGNPDLAPAMAESGINVVTMANNHAMDLGGSGLLDTIKHCEKHDIAVVGAGKDRDAAMAPAVLETDDGIKVAFLGFSDVLPVGYPATAASAGIAAGRADLNAVKKVIKAAKKEADFVIVGWHWNFEYKRAPSQLELDEGRAAVDAGADIVFAHHPHLLNGVEAYNDGLIFYSLGNLVFSGFSGETAETVLVRAKVTEDRIDAQLVPVIGGGSGVPNLASGSQADSILERFRSFSADLDTNVKIANGKGYVSVRR